MQTLPIRNRMTMKNKKTLEVATPIEVSEDKNQIPVPTEKSFSGDKNFDVASFIRQYRNDSTFLLAFVR